MPDRLRQHLRDIISLRPQVGLVLGPVAFLTMLWMPTPQGLSDSAWQVLALTLLMASWWVTEAAPLAVTALLPITLLPLLGIQGIQQAAAPYANPLIFLFLGGFIIAGAIQRWDLHRRLSLLVLSLSGTRPDRVVAGFMIATAILSMWVSNTATSALMVPIGLSVLKLLHRDDDTHRDNLSLCLLLGIALGANIGGMATLIGTPPNALLAGYLRSNHDITIGFGQWMLFALPLSIVLLALAWHLLTRHIYPIAHHPIDGLSALIHEQRQSLGRMSRPERLVVTVFTGVALTWLTRPLLLNLWPGLGLTDAGIAILGAVALFVIPIRWRPLTAAMDWEATKSIPWGVLLLVGGGLSLGNAIESSGLATAIAAALHGMTGWHFTLVIAVVVATIMGLSHVTSNTATTATMLPIAASLAVDLNLAVPLLCVPVALAASSAYMLPVATPPNAIIFSSQLITVPQMVRAGASISPAALLLITVWTLLFTPLLAGQ
ncbi:SLC13 family permease [Tamilnaduibacter salinus]|uniref:SLC13 family permease n=1 Tax=Tamilnaduibacter salinus TaxID=1484056 RepID=UPI001FAFF9D1|nr:DASS family sodium-coupled anion symporter [Tamilnaduibacter salinus]